MRCHQCNLHTFTLYVFTLIRVVSCFRSEEAEGKLTGDIPFMKDIANMHEGNENALLGQTEFKRSLADDDSYESPRIVEENFMKDDLMAMPTPVKFREKRSKHSKRRSKKSTVESDGGEQGNSKDELMNILGTIQTAKHRRLTRQDIRKLARKAFANMKLKKKGSKKPTEKGASQKKKDGGKKIEKAEPSEQMIRRIQGDSKDKEKASERSDTNKVENKADKAAVDAINEPNMKHAEDKSALEDEKAFASMFDDSAKTKNSELSEDITNLQDNKKTKDIVSDDKMSKNSESKGFDTAALGSKKSYSPTESSFVVKTTEKQIEQELNKEFSMKEKDNPTLAEKPVNLMHEVSKKSNVPETARQEKIKTLKTLLAKANKSKVPKKFLGKFPAGLRMIAWRELLDKKKKELGELESTHEDEKTDKKDSTTSVNSRDNQPLTIDINIDSNGEKSPKVSAKNELGLDEMKKDKDTGSHHIASHVKYLQKHLASVQDLRKIISRALIGHCHATGKRILKAFIAMDRALSRAQKIATVIGKKFKVDASKIENIVVHKEDEVVESFLRDIFANFN